MQLKIVDTFEGLCTLANTLQRLEIFAFDTETTGLDWTRHEIFLLSFSDGETSWMVPTNRFPKGFLVTLLTDVFKDEKKWVVGQNLKFDAHHVMQSYGVTIKRQWHDTQLMAYLMDENRSNSLKKLMQPLLGVEPADEAKIHAWMKEHQGIQDNWDFSKVPEELMFPYAAMDSWATFKLYENLKPQIEANFADLYDTDRQVLKILWKMEQNGVYVDKPMLELFHGFQSVEQDEYRRKLYLTLGREFDINSSDELRKIFYEELKMPVKFKTKKEKLPSTEDDALSAMDHPLAELLQLYRGLQNTINYAKGILAMQDANGIVHGNYSITRARTGRFSCSEPNLQNVPKNKGLRSCFVPNIGLDMFYFDHAQIEMVGFAHYSKDLKMVAALNGGEDLHALAAAEVYGIPLSAVSKEQRAVGKGTNFSIIYGVGKKKLATYINGYMPGKKLTDAEAQQFKEKYFARFPSVVRFQTEAQGAVRRTREPWGHFIKNQFGRVRRIQDPQQKAYTAVNHLIQGWAPDVMKKGMVKIEKQFSPMWRQNVHDELRIDIPSSLSTKERAEMVGEMVRSLTDFPEVRVPIKCKVEWSPTSWADLQLYKPEEVVK